MYRLHREYWEQARGYNRMVDPLTELHFKKGMCNIINNSIVNLTTRVDLSGRERLRVGLIQVMAEFKSFPNPQLSGSNPIILLNQSFFFLILIFQTFYIPSMYDIFHYVLGLWTESYFFHT